MDPEDMPPVDFKKDSKKISLLQRHLIAKVNEFNVTRAAKTRRQNKRANILGCGLGLLALSIYGYTMYAVRQETFLDDLEVPETYISRIQPS